MKNSKAIWVIVIILAIGIWHLIVNASKGVKVSGLFTEKLLPGYIWKDGTVSETKSFFGNTNVKWQPGLEHPYNNVMASWQPGKWVPLPGYELLDEELLVTRWVPGTKHPSLKAYSTASEGFWLPDDGYVFSTDMQGNTVTIWKPGQPHSVQKAYASTIEGEWIPYLGYEFRKSYLSQKLETVWVSGTVFTDKKLVSSTEENKFIPFPGYQFIDSTKSVEVVWTPGSANPENPNLVADSEPDTWKDNSITTETQDNEPSKWGYLLRSWLSASIGDWIEKEAGTSNSFSDAFYKQSFHDLGKSIEKAVNEP